MKPPETIAIYGPVDTSPEATTRAALELFLDELKGSLGPYFARLEYDRGEGSYEPTEEYLNLKGREDLLERVKTQRNCMWRCHVTLGFANSYVYPAVFADPGGGSETTLLLTLEPAITRFIESAEETRAPFAIFLARVARAIGSRWFISGLHLANLETWQPLPATRILGWQQLKPYPYVLGWKAGALDEQMLVGEPRLTIDDIRRTTLTYHFATLFPPAPP